MTPILTAAEMRAAEAAAIAAGTPASLLMERAGTAAADAIGLYAGPMPCLVLCGPGNNGGDGYVIARLLRARGVDVRIAALAEPRTDAARQASAAWSGPVQTLADAAPAPLLVDALFGTGLTRPLDQNVCDKLQALAGAARVRVAVDLPSGAATDDGRLLSPVPDFDLTVTFATRKPAHLLQPAARHMGRLVVADIGVAAESELTRLERPKLAPPGPADHKYTRGYVAALAGAMPGAIALVAAAAARAGAGYVRLIADVPVADVPAAVVQSGGDPAAILNDSRIGALAVGPGLGRDEHAASLLDVARQSAHPLVLDADALHLMRPEQIAPLDQPPILTPHGGEFTRLFGALPGSKVDQARAAAARSKAVIVYKGADTVIAAPDGRAAIAPPAPAWLATAGTGDVLAGIIAAMRARGLPPFEAGCAGVWLHREAARRAGGPLIADDLLGHLPAALAACR